MDWLRTILETSPLTALFLTIAVGYLIGELNLKGFALGSGAVLFVAIYLGGGYAWPINGMWGSYRVTRGDIDLVPANTLHTFGNAGGDPLDVVFVIPK